MKLTSLLPLATLATTALAKMEPCALSETYTYDPFNATTSPSATLRGRATITIDLWVHYLVSSPQNANDLIDSNGLYKQLNYLIANYAPYGIFFILKPVSYAMNADWASGIDASKAEKMRQLHRGDYTALNIYAVEGATSGVCSLPLAGTAALTQDQLDGDGCFIPLKSAQQAPDGTLTHEIGHWFGLLHVFNGGCDGDDFCADTAAQAGPSYAHMQRAGDFNSCPATDSCPTKPGLDNVKNFMDYTDCSSEFTPMQGSRMNAVYNSFRAGRAIAAGVRWK